jgi:hypothetical protein
MAPIRRSTISLAGRRQRHRNGSNPNLNNPPPKKANNPKPKKENNTKPNKENNPKPKKENNTKPKKENNPKPKTPPLMPQPTQPPPPPTCTSTVATKKLPTPKRYTTPMEQKPLIPLVSVALAAPYTNPKSTTESDDDQILIAQITSKL